MSKQTHFNAVLVVACCFGICVLVGCGNGHQESVPNQVVTETPEQFAARRESEVAKAVADAREAREAEEAKSLVAERAAKEEAETQRTAELQERVRKQLKDPSSAIFDAVTVSETGAICGTVNARNGFGGYTGAQPFVATDKYVLVQSSAANESTAVVDAAMRLEKCR